MSTNSTITVRTANNERKMIYCHFDGYPNHNGAILLEHYNTVDKAKELVELGDLSILGHNIHPDPNKEHSFHNAQKNVCVYYARDRNESNCKAKVLSNGEPLFESQKRLYNYFFDGEKWFLNVKGRGNNKMILTREICGL